MDWFLYDNGLRHERVRQEVSHFVRLINYNFTKTPLHFVSEDFIHFFRTITFKAPCEVKPRFSASLIFVQIDQCAVKED